MYKIWSSESSAIIISFIVMILLGTVFEHWFTAISVTLTGYIFWLYYRLYKLERWLSRGTKASEVYDDNGFLGLIIRHLYRQRKAYNKRKKSTKDILRRLNRNIAALPDATVLLNDRFEIEWSNPPAQYLLGVDARNDIGQRIGNLIRHPRFLRYLLAPDKNDHLDIKSHLDNNISLQIKIVQFGKNQRLLTARNISDQKQLQEGLKNFIANASHELKTPLTVISGHLEMLENEPGLSDSGNKSVHSAQKQSERMKHLIQDLLLLSRVESYQLQPNEGDSVSISDVMRNTMNAIGKSCDDDQIICHSPDHFYLKGIQSEIEGICINLVDNAIKHTPGQTTIEISWKENNQGEYVFSVSDKGPGISESDLPHLTERYYRGSKSTAQQIQGSGLGLAIVEQGAAKHGATLEIKSQPGRGSTFSVIFPSYRVISEPNIPTKILPFKAS